MLNVVRRRERSSCGRPATAAQRRPHESARRGRKFPAGSRLRQPASAPRRFRRHASNSARLSALLPRRGNHQLVRLHAERVASDRDIDTVPGPELRCCPLRAGVREMNDRSVRRVSANSIESFDDGTHVGGPLGRRKRARKYTVARPMAMARSAAPAPAADAAAGDGRRRHPGATARLDAEPSAPTISFSMDISQASPSFRRSFSSSCWRRPAACGRVGGRRTAQGAYPVQGRGDRPVQVPVSGCPRSDARGARARPRTHRPHVQD